MVVGSLRAQFKNSEPLFPWRGVAVGSGLYLIFVFLTLGLAPIGGSSEAREAQVIDVILKTGEWILPRRNGIVPSKPPLFHWIAAAFNFFQGEVSEQGARLPSLFAATGILWFAALCSFQLAKLSGRSHVIRNAHHVALVTLAMLSLCFGFLQMATVAMVDMVFAFCTIVAVTAPLTTDRELWQERRELSSGARGLFWTAAATAVLARGPVGIVLPLALVCVPAALLFGFKLVAREVVRLSWGWVAFCVPLSWYLVAIERGGAAFVERQLFFENVARVVGHPHMNSEPWWFYFVSIFRTTFPWGVVCVILLVCWPARVSISRMPPDQKRSHAILYIPGIAAIFGVVLFSLASGKRHSYLLPLYPLIIVQCALLLADRLMDGAVMDQERIHRNVIAIVNGLVGLILLLVVAFWWSTQDWGLFHPLYLELQVTMVAISLPVAFVLIGSLIPAMRVTHSRLMKLLSITWLLLIALLSTSLAIGNTIKANLKGFPLMAALVGDRVSINQQLVVIKDQYDEYFDPIIFYFRRPIEIQDQASTTVPCKDSMVYLAHREWLENFEYRLAGKVTVIDVLREFLDAVEERASRELVLFTCVPNPTVITDSFQGVALKKRVPSWRTERLPSLVPVCLSFMQNK